MFNAKPANARRAFAEIINEALTHGPVQVSKGWDSETPAVFYSQAIRTRTGSEIHRTGRVLRWNPDRNDFTIYGGARSNCGVNAAIDTNATITCGNCR